MAAFIKFSQSVSEQDSEQKNPGANDDVKIVYLDGDDESDGNGPVCPNCGKKIKPGEILPVRRKDNGQFTAMGNVRVHSVCGKEFILQEKEAFINPGFDIFSGNFSGWQQFQQQAEKTLQELSESGQKLLAPPSDGKNIVDLSKLPNLRPTIYGYKGDPYSDSLTLQRLGVQNRVLDNFSTALSPDVEAYLAKTHGLRPGNWMYVEYENPDNDPRLKGEWRRFDDRTASSYKGKKILGRFDIYTQDKNDPRQTAKIKSLTVAPERYDRNPAETAGRLRAQNNSISRAAIPAEAPRHVVAPGTNTSATNNNTQISQPNLESRINQIKRRARPGFSKISASQHPEDFPKTGPGAVQAFLDALDPDEEEKYFKDALKSGVKAIRPRATRALGLLTGLKRNNLHPRDLMVTKVPVIPPQFRPYSVAGDTFIPGDVNELYGQVIKIRDAFEEEKNEIGDVMPETRASLRRAVRAVYGVDDPDDAGLRARNVSGFLRQITGAGPKYSFPVRKLLSKPQDSVARGTITADPELTMDEIGVPEDMAWTIYGAHTQKRLVNRAGLSPAQAIKEVKDRTEMARKHLEEEMKERPVVYNRAPSWHKYNVISAFPKIVKGDVVRVSPIVMTGMSGDFDGDAVQIHAPATNDGKIEAIERLLPSRMVFSERFRDRLVPLPKHEMILGLYAAKLRKPSAVHKFSSREEALNAIKKGLVSLKDEIEIPN